jgi:hypothetical protein
LRAVDFRSASGATIDMPPSPPRTFWERIEKLIERVDEGHLAAF